MRTRDEAALSAPTRLEPRDILSLKRIYPSFPRPSKVILTYQDQAEAAAAAAGLHRYDFALSATLHAGPGDVAVARLRGVGAPVAAMALEELAVLGTHTVVSVGTGGRLQPGLAIGDVVLLVAAFRDEGTSNHYAQPSEFSHADAGLSDWIEGCLGPRIATRGRGWTTDAPYRETIAEIEEHRSNGLLVADMESSAVFSVAKRLGMKAGAVSIISDDLLGRSTTYHPSASQETLHDIVSLLIDCLSR